MGLLDPVDFGLVAAALVIIGAAGLLAGLGTGTAIIRREMITPQFLSGVFRFNVLFGFFLLGMMTLFAGAAASLMTQHDAAQVIPVLGAILATSGLGIVQYQLFARRMRLDCQGSAGKVHPGWRSWSTSIRSSKM